MEDTAGLIPDFADLQRALDSGGVSRLLNLLRASEERAAGNGGARRILKHVRVAVRLDHAWLSEYPETLFPCLWNRCWWFDCPDRKIFLPARDDRPPLLHRQLERWRAERQGGVRSAWLRSLRPPVVGLDSGLVADIHLDAAGRCTWAGVAPDGSIEIEYEPVYGSRQVSGALRISSDNGIDTIPNRGRSRERVARTGVWIRTGRRRSPPMIMDAHDNVLAEIDTRDESGRLAFLFEGAFSEDGSRLALRGERSEEECVLLVYEVFSEGGALKTSLIASGSTPSPFGSLALSSRGNRLAVLEYAAVRLIDPLDFENDVRIPLAPRFGDVVAVTDDGETVAVIGDCRRLQVYEPDRYRADGADLRSQDHSRVMFSHPSGRLLYSQPHFWDALTGHPLGTVEEDEPGNYLEGGPPQNSHHLTDDRLIISDHGLRIADTASCEIIATYRERPEDLSYNIRTIIAHRHDGRFLAVSDRNGNTVYLLAVESGRVLHALDVPGRASAMAYSPDGLLLLVGSENPAEGIRVLASGPDGLEERSGFFGHSAAISSITFSHDGARVLSTGAKERLRIWNLADGREIFSRPLISEDARLTGYYSDPHYVDTVTADGQVLFRRVPPRKYGHRLHQGRMEVLDESGAALAAIRVDNDPRRHPTEAVWATPELHLVLEVDG